MQETDKYQNVYWEAYSVEGKLSQLQYTQIHSRFVAKRTKAYFFRDYLGVVMPNNEAPASCLRKLSFRYLSSFYSQERDNLDGQLKKILRVEQGACIVTEKILPGIKVQLNPTLL